MITVVSDDVLRDQNPNDCGTKNGQSLRKRSSTGSSARMHFSVAGYAQECLD